jgi:hypothetical protein
MLKAKGYQQITSLASSTALTVPDGTCLALIQAQGQDVRWRDDGTDPTATVGMLLSAGESMEYDVADVAVVEFIQVAATAILNVSYYGGV